MYSVLKQINSETLIAEKSGIKYILKRIDFSDIDIIKALINIKNPNIVQFIELTAINNNYYCVEEFVDGITLEDYVKRFGAVNDERGKMIVYEICIGLRDIHNLGIVHRDINPSNIMIDKYGHIKIIDFGISRFCKESNVADTQILGTQGYAAPEQYGFSQTSRKADIYSLGVLINYIKTLTLPNQVKADGLLGEIAEKCTQIDEKNRYNNVDEIITAIKTGKADKKHISLLLPGFRSGVKYKMILSSIYYVFTVLIFFAFLLDPDENNNVFFAMLDLFLLIIPVFIFSDYLGWSEKLNISKKHSRRFICYLFGIIYVILTFFLFIIIYNPK